MLAPIIDQVLIYFICDGVYVVFRAQRGDEGKFFLAVNLATRILGVVDHDGLGPGTKGLSQFLSGKSEVGTTEGYVTNIGTG